MPGSDRTSVPAAASRRRSSPGPKSLLTLFGAEHSGLGGVAGYDAAETTDEDPERVAAVARLAWAYLRTGALPGGSRLAGRPGRAGGQPRPARTGREERYRAGLGSVAKGAERTR